MTSGWVVTHTNGWIMQDAFGRPMERGPGVAARPGSSQARRRSRATGDGRPLLGVIAAVAPVALTVATLPLATGDDLARHVAILVAMILPYSVAGGVLLARGAAQPIGALFVAVGGIVAIGETSSRYASWGRLTSAPLWREAAWLSDLLWFVPLLLLGIFLLLLFPTGRPPNPRWRWVALTGGVGLTIVLVALGLGTWAGRGASFVPGATAPLPVAAAVPAVAGAIACLVALVSAVAALIVRFRRSSSTERLQLRWFVVAGVLTTLGILLLFALPIGWLALVATFPLVPLATGTAVLRYRLYDLPRLLVHGGALVLLVVVVMAAQGAVLALLGPSIPALAAAGVTVALAAGTPTARRGAQAAARRLLPGDADPHAAVVRLGWQLEAVSDPREVVASSVHWLTDVLPVETATVALADGTPVAAHERGDRSNHLDVPAAAAHHGGGAADDDLGVAAVDRVDIPLVRGGHATGVLRLTRRADDDPVTRRDRRLLDELAPHLAAATEALELHRELERTHAEVVSSREEERRRIRRDLHDQLGPTLAAIALGLEALTESLAPDDARRTELLAPLREAASEAVDDIRRIVDDLRPPALDELGLPAAIRQAAEQLVERAGARVTYDLPADLPALPAAVEVAVLRIATEALTNVARHAGAARCRLEVRVGDAVELEVADDGRGFAPLPASAAPRTAASPSHGRRDAEHRARPRAADPVPPSVGNRSRRRPGHRPEPAVPHQPPGGDRPSAPARQGAGLRSMQERAHELGGWCEISSRQPRGTRVLAHIPVAVP